MNDLVSILVIFMALNKVGYYVSGNVVDQNCDFLTIDPSSEDCNVYWNGEPPPVLLISLDGFRSEYLKRTIRDEVYAAPTIKCLAERGVSTAFMIPSYPTSTFPNHYSIVTGLYPESHEIVGNSFFDPELKAEFSIRSPNARDSKWWRSGEPIWSTVRKHGKKSATYFWPGSDVEHNDERAPNYYYKYNKSTPIKERIRKVLEWFDMPPHVRPSFVTLYSEEPDSTGHQDGPSSSTVTEKISLVDKHIRSLLDGLQASNISSCINILIVSDHGMAESPNKKQLVNLEEYAPSLLNESLTFFGPVTAIYPNSQGKKSNINLSKLSYEMYEDERLLEALTCKSEKMKAFSKTELPYRLHFSKSPRIGSIVLEFSIGWRGIFREERYSGNGAHGWDNLHQEMQAIFVGYGPSLKSAVEVQPFENVQLYNLMCALLTVTPAVNNGTWGALHQLLIDPPVPEVSGEYEDLTLRVLHITSETATTRFCESNDTFELDLRTVDEDRENELISIHAPLGIPLQRIGPNSSYQEDEVLLINEDYIQLFDTKRGVSMLSSYTVANVAQNITSPRKWIKDPRLEVGMKSGCTMVANTSSTFSEVNLFPEEFASRLDDAWLDTNIAIVPFEMNSIKKTMTKLMRDAYLRTGNLNVIVGIIEQMSSSTLFYIISSCTSQVNLTYCPAEQREVQAFLLPTKQWMRSRHCTTEEEFIAFNVATLKDVENFTGFDFFTDLSVDDKALLLSRTVFASNLVIDSLIKS